VHELESDAALLDHVAQFEAPGFFKMAMRSHAASLLLF
jgi:hypothetical protein